MRSELLLNTVFWDVAPCSLVHVSLMIERASSSEMSVKIHQTPLKKVFFFIKGMWKDTVVVCFKVGYYPNICLQADREITRIMSR
jgi:hypothetical protein